MFHKRKQPVASFLQRVSSVWVWGKGLPQSSFTGYTSSSRIAQEGSKGRSLQVALGEAGWEMWHIARSHSFPLPLKVTMMRWRDQCPLLLLSWWNPARGRASGKWATRGKLWHSVYDPLDHWQCNLEGMSPDFLTLACCGLVQDQKITWQNRDFHTNREH